MCGLLGCNTIVGLSTLEELPEGPTDDGAVTDVASSDADSATSAPDLGTGDGTIDASVETGTPLDTGAGDTGTGDTGTMDTGPSDTGTFCPTGKGPSMVQIGTFCIDRTEVTVGQYRMFVASGASASDPKLRPPSSVGDEDVCAWNTTLAPSKSIDTLDVPATYIDWCDAYAYCKWAGKRLCGALPSAGGGATPWVSTLKPDVDQWLYACTNGNQPTKFPYPYGATYEKICNDGTGSSVPASIRAVGSFPKCVGASAPYSQIADMSGNAVEWGDSCFRPTGTTSAAKDMCIARGGGYTTTTTTRLRCADENEYSRDNNTFDGIGFRCCAY